MFLRYLSQATLQTSRELQRIFSIHSSNNNRKHLCFKIRTKLQNMFDILPNLPFWGHFFGLQNCKLKRQPWQSLPPFIGGGLVHTRMRILMEWSPHVEEQSDHDVHSVKPPSTWIKFYTILCKMLIFTRVLHKLKVLSTLLPFSIHTLGPCIF